MNNKTKVFVYGTLRRGYGNHRLLENSEFLGNAITKEKYELTANGIPFVNPDKPTSNIVGEVYEVDNETLKSLDRLEGYDAKLDDGWYMRREISVMIEDKEEKASIYFNSHSKGVLIEDGNYATYRKKIK